MVDLLHLVLVDLPRAPLENVGLGTALQLPVGTPALVGRSWHLVEAFVEGEVVSDGVLPVASVHAIVGVSGTDGLVDFGEGEHAVGRVHESLGDQLGVGHPRLGEGVRHVDGPAFDVLQALRLLAVLGVEDVLATVVEALKVNIQNEGSTQL